MTCECVYCGASLSVEEARYSCCEQCEAAFSRLFEEDTEPTPHCPFDKWKPARDFV